MNIKRAIAIHALDMCILLCILLCGGVIHCLVISNCISLSPRPLPSRHSISHPHNLLHSCSNLSTLSSHFLYLYNKDLTSFSLFAMIPPASRPSDKSVLHKLRMIFSIPTGLVLTMSSVAGCLIGYEAGLMSGHIIMSVCTTLLVRMMVRLDDGADWADRTLPTVSK